MIDSPSIDGLKRALRRLPGVGPRTAQRMAFHLLERDREGGRLIAQALTHALDAIRHCTRCNNFSESELCDICRSPRRDGGLVCVVETPADLESMENAGFFGGLYFVLMGHLSPLDGIGPDEIGVTRLLDVVSRHEVREVVLATNLTNEGEATADYIADLLREERDVAVSRLARGVPVGGELEYMDQGTLAQAFEGRRAVGTARATSD